MLFTDGNFITSALLDQIDGEFSAVASAEGMDTSAFIAEAVNSAGSELIAKIQNFSGYLVGVGVNANHLAAVLNVLSTAINRPRALLNQIPATEPNPTRTAFRRWVQFYCLYEFYLTVSNRKVKDRYEQKAKKYEAQKKRHWENLKGNGFPVVLNPLPCPGATLEYNSGSWSNANVTAVAGGASIASADYDVAITWCSLPTYVSSANQGNAESAGAVTQTITVPAGDVISIDITSLNPPNGTVATAIGTAQGVYSPLAATHWNIYAGEKYGTLYLQNSSPIPVATTSYTFTDAPVLSGFPLGAGQAAMYDFAFLNMLWRA
jgi:hypothetical protein